MMDTKQIEKELSRRMSEKRFKHTLGVVETALNLAERYGVNLQKAELAALLHDCARGYKDEQLLQMADKYDLEVDYIHQELPAMLHGPVGAVLAEQDFEVKDQEVLQAIAIHTLGADSMTELDKVIMLADAIEPGRKYDSARRLREQVYSAGTGLNQATIYCLDFKIRFVLESKCLLHPVAVNARNALILDLKQQ